MSKQTETSFTVVGPNRVRGVEPGDTFKADPDDPQIHRLLRSGNIAAEAKASGAKGNATAKAADNGDDKETP